jgi:hypothetical protein
MKKIVTLISALLIANVASADPLKDSLQPTKGDATPSVNLDNLNVGAPMRMVSPPSRSGMAVIGSVNGINILKKSADEFLKMATKGKVNDFDRLPPKQRLDVLNNVASSMILEEKALKEISQETQKKIVAQYWMQQKMQTITVTSEEAKGFYEQNKQLFKGQGGSILPYDQKIEQYIMMSLKQQKFSKEMMKDAKISLK